MGNPIQPSQWKEVELAARSLGIEPQLLDVRRTEELTQAFDAAAKQHAEALIVALDGVTSVNLRLIAELATKHRLPSMYVYNEYLDVGGLISYGADELHSSRRAAAFVDKILKGVKPGDLPVEQARKFELGINLRVAKALGISVPKSVMLRADRVIE